jgi:hypothetical protein
MSVTKGQAAWRKQEIVTRLEVIVAELESYESDLGQVLPLSQYATYATAVGRLRRLAGRLQPGSGEVPASTGSGQEAEAPIVQVSSRLLAM